MTIQIRYMNDEKLLKETKALAMEERRITAQLLLFLKEVEYRRLYATLGYSSLFDYVTGELGYSDGSAQRRINSMFVLKELPEVEEKIKSGALTLTHVVQAQRFFKNEVKHSHPMNIEQKREVLLSLEGKSTREAERELVSRSSNPETFIRKDQIRVVTQTLSQVTFVADQELLDQFEEIRGLLAHQGSMSIAELLKEMAKLAIEKLHTKKFAKAVNPKANSESRDTLKTVNKPCSVTPVKSAIKTNATSTVKATTKTVSMTACKATTKTDFIVTDKDFANPHSINPFKTKIQTGSKNTAETATKITTSGSDSQKKLQTQKQENSSAGVAEVRSRYIPSGIKRQVYQRDKGQCTYVNQTTGRRCGSRYALEYHHIQDFAKNGETSVENLALKCRAHNQAHAIQSYGMAKMAKYFG